MGKIKIVSETKKETVEKEPPANIDFKYVPGETDMNDMKKFLKKYLS